jgi:hypothetical protein
VTSSGAGQGSTNATAQNRAGVGPVHLPDPPSFANMLAAELVSRLVSPFVSTANAPPPGWKGIPSQTTGQFAVEVAAAVSGGKALRILGRAGQGLAAEGLGATALDDAALVCRGGTCNANRFANGSGVTMDASGKLQGVSVNSGTGATLEE